MSRAAFEGRVGASARLPEEVRCGLLTPALLLDLDAARRNVARVIALCGGDPDRWRPHLKTTKCPELWALLIEAGVRRFKVATTRELAVLLELLSERRVEDAQVLVAQSSTAPAAQRIAELAARTPGVRVAVIVEDPVQVAWTPEPLELFVDLDPGGERTGRGFEQESALLETARAAGARLGGLHSYEGHLHGPQPERGEQLDALFERIVGLVRRWGDAGLSLGEVVSSGTPAFGHVLERAPLAELGVHHTVSPGTVVLHDLRSELENPELGLEPAATVLARVVALPRAGRATLDAGSKALAAEAGDPVAIVLGKSAWRARTPNEEHLPLEASAGAPELALGELVELVPRHVCPTVNLHERALALEGDGLREVEIAARAHEVLVLPGLGAERRR